MILPVSMLVASALAAPAAAAPAARTADLDQDGRVDAIALDGRAAGATVPGRKVLARRGHTLTLRASGAPDTAVRPVVRLAGGRRVKAADGAAPRLLSVTRVGDHTLRARFSEPVRVAATQLRVALADGSVAAPASVRRRGRTLTVTVAGAPLGLAVSPAAIWDGAGNRTPKAAQVVPGATPAPKTPAAAVVAPPAAPATPGRGAPAAPPAPVPTAAPAETATPAATATPEPTAAPATWQALTNPIDPRQQTDLDFCERSHYLQPWRAYLDTRPASSLREALGINLNVGGDLLSPVSTLLAGSGFSRYRYELGWDRMRFDDPTAMEDPLGLAVGMTVTKLAGLRPLILLNANHGAPGPTVHRTFRLVADAAAGDRTVRLSPRSAAAVVPGRSGLSAPGKAAAILFTAVDADGVATLSKPLPEDVAAGRLPGAILRFAPFGAPVAADGTPNPAFEATMAGWLDYVDAITGAVAGVYGDDFDVEIWNEETFGSDFLDAATYYDDLPEGLRGTGDVKQELLRRTVAFLRDPANGVSGIGIGDGFANQTPFAAGSTSPVGLTAIDKHPYSGARQAFGGEPATRACRPVNALGEPEGTDLGGNQWRDDFTPAYTSYFPEYYLNGIQTEHLIRDLSPITTTVGGVAHGRDTAPAGGTPPELWVTETNMDPDQAGLTGAAARRMQAKAALRTLVSFVSKGATAVDFYSAAGRQFGLVDPAFFERLLEGDLDLGLGGTSTDAFRRLLDAVGGTTETGAARTLTLESVADRGEVLMAGDGTAAHPDVHARDWTAVFPFQSGPRRFAVAAYVMTRDVAADLEPVTERITLGGLDGARATVEAYDPLEDRATPARIVARTATTVTIEAELTDSVRVLTVGD